ncbi:hypothetical protein [Anabaena catenula]|uniref:Uncharacterized protein n=1 Tax=Anabaena catenula FACHB-362 TaxID=2692877 RepID=A0ABR8J4V9_9NOST|nr:hypothetical protein [Anabaena catenula]MBD2692643.1 hypothetical protein [Anabaena catenula FACHB-362]
MTWTNKHDAFCLENHIPPAAKLLWQWLLHHHKESEELEPELKKEFNAWVQKHRGRGYHVNTIKTALARLIDCRVVQVLKQWSWHEVRIITRPLDFFKPKKNSQNRHQIDKRQPSNDISTEKEVCSSSNNSISEEQILEHEQVLTECENVGIVFDPIGSPEILNYCHEEVKLAIALFHKRGGHEKIKNPQGWLLQCLRRCWYDQPKNWSFTDLLIALGIQKT